MPRMRVLALALVLAAAAVPAAQAAQAAPACVTGTAAEAARALYGGELVSQGRVAGMRTALALEPRIFPGTRRRMLQAPSGAWCDAATGFNRAFRGSAEEAVTTFARVAAAPYFDGVTVRSVRRAPGGAFLVETHARTNGVVARWVVAADETGVRTARWTATAFAQRPLVAELEGLTALPGATEAYTRLAGGLLDDRRGLPTAASARAAASEPQAPAVYTSPDGAQIRLSIGDSRVAVDPGVSTGVFQADILRNTMEAIRLNYQEYYDWGLRKGWESDLDPVLGDNVGWVYIDNALSLYCLACVFIANDFQIHMVSEVVNVFKLLGFTGYNDDVKAYQNVLGHEMFHNFQNAYNNPGPLGRSAGRSVSVGFSEGTARFQEALHSYSGVSFAPKTLLTGGQTNPPLLVLDSNTCNGYGATDAAMAAGPFGAGKTYNSCYFFTSWFNQNGGRALVDLVAKAIPANATQADVPEGVAALAAAAPGVPLADQLGDFALSALTSLDQTVAALSGGAPARDWGSFFFEYKPAALAPGGRASQALTGGGIFARRIDAPATVSLTGKDLALYVVRQDALGASVTRATGTAALAPAAGERLWVVAVNPTGTTATATLSAAA